MGHIASSPLVREVDHRARVHVTAIVQATRITKAFGKTPAVRDVDLEVQAGTILALLGPNGAGKTTMIRVLTTLLRPDRGTVVIAGHDALREPDRSEARSGSQVSPSRSTST
jgi:ABC-type multidrug transport system ATPase subunit